MSASGKQSTVGAKGSPEAIRAAERKQFDGITHAVASTIGEVLDELAATGAVSARLRKRLVEARAALRRTCPECVADDNAARKKAAEKKAAKR